MYVCIILSYRIEGYEGVSVSEGQRKNILDRLKIVLYNVDILIKEESYARIRPRITIDCCCVVCYSGISVQQLHPVHLRRIDMEYFGYFSEQARYEAEQELNEWYDQEEENYIMMMQQQEVIPEVIE